MQTSLSTASSTNSYTKTFDGIDVAGRRLANEVRPLKFVLEKRFQTFSLLETDISCSWILMNCLEALIIVPMETGLGSG
jgi:hypothetical protein